MHRIITQIVLCLALPLSALASEAVTKDAVEAALHEYVVAKYAGDVETMRSRVHIDLARRSISNRYWGEPSREWVRDSTHDQLKFYGTQYNQSKRDDPENGRAEVTVFDIESMSASAVMVMDGAVEYVHAIHFDGRWLIADSTVIRLANNDAEAPTPTHDADDAIAQVVRDYAVGFYEVDGMKVQGTCHPSLSKRTIEKRQNLDFNFMSSISWDEIELLGETFNARGKFDPTTARVDVEIYQVSDNVAAAKLVGSVWFDYFHILRVNEEWKIVNIIYESLPPDRHQDA